jgi:uncharacterized YigZ family protein
MDDTYRTIRAKAEGTYSQQRSKFLAFALPVHSTEEVRQFVAEYQKQYYDARHVCYAYMLGPERTAFRANDNGEPSGTAGRPILGQINSHDLTDILIIVVRYFGGVKLGTSGLIVAYRTAAAVALEAAAIEQRLVCDEVRVCFDYLHLNAVMRIVKDEGPDIVSQHFDTRCTLTLRIRRSLTERLTALLLKVPTLQTAD